MRLKDKSYLMRLGEQVSLIYHPNPISHAISAMSMQKMTSRLLQDLLMIVGIQTSTMSSS
jgi:hypothetical protein